MTQKDRYDDLRQVLSEKGFQACLDEANKVPYDIKAVMVCEGLNEGPYWSAEARAFANELEKGHPDESYMMEKFSHLAQFFQVLHRFGGKPNRHGDAESQKLWDDIYNKTMKARGR